MRGAYDPGFWICKKDRGRNRRSGCRGRRPGFLLPLHLPPGVLPEPAPDPSGSQPRGYGPGKA
jgi:hypothetical protein